MFGTEDETKDKTDKVYRRAESAQCQQQTGNAPPGMPEDYALNELFSYHPPFGDANLRYENIRSAAKQFAKAVLINVPPGADRTAAIRKIREAVMTANAGVALNGFSL
jgi:hypothetical protein